MSEYQFVDFRAVDRPVSDKDLEYMQKQSSRAEITQWRFSNEYHYGEFGGNANEMLRRGYDAHLHFANFGVRKLMFRLPQGLPCDEETFSQYAVEDFVVWEKDKSGPGRILSISPEADAGTYDYLEDVESYLDRLLSLREDLIGGDLRPLFLAWLACTYDDDAKVPPIPAGLSKLTLPLKALAKFYEIPDKLLKAAAKGSAPAPAAIDKTQGIQDWAAKQSKSDLQTLVAELLGGDSAGARSKTLAEINNVRGVSSWPTTPSASMTFAELCNAAGFRRPEY